MSPHFLAAILFAQSILVGAAAFWLLDLSLLLGFGFGILFGAFHGSLILIGHKRGWLRANVLNHRVRWPLRRPTLLRLVYGVGLALIVGTGLGIVYGFSALLWLVWLPFLAVSGFLFAWTLDQR